MPVKGILWPQLKTDFIWKCILKILTIIASRTKWKPIICKYEINIRFSQKLWNVSMKNILSQKKPNRYDSRITRNSNCNHQMPKQKLITHTATICISDKCSGETWTDNCLDFFVVLCSTYVQEGVLIKPTLSKVFVSHKDPTHFRCSIVKKSRDCARK